MTLFLLYLSLFMSSKLRQKNMFFLKKIALNLIPEHLLLTQKKFQRQNRRELKNWFQSIERIHKNMNTISSTLKEILLVLFDSFNYITSCYCLWLLFSYSSSNEFLSTVEVTLWNILSCDSPLRNSLVEAIILLEMNIIKLKPLMRSFKRKNEHFA